MPKGGFLDSIVSIRIGSAASSCSIFVMPALANFRTATIPIWSICLSCNTESSQAFAPRLRDSSRACLALTESPWANWQSMMQRMIRLMWEKTRLLSCWNDNLCFWNCSPDGSSTAPNSDWIRSVILWAERFMSVFIGNLMPFALFISLYRDFSPGFSRISRNLSAWAMTESWQLLIRYRTSKQVKAS